MSDNAQITVKEIFALLRNGKQREGVELLYKHHYNKMFGVAFSIVKKEDIGKDIVHNVVYKLMLLEPSKFPSSSELTWLYKVVKNEALMFLRKKNPIISLEDLAIEPIVEDKNINDSVDMDAYYSMIKGLNDEQQQVVTLKVLGGYTHKEISIMLGKPIGTIQWIYNTSIKKLRITLSSILVAIVLSGVGFFARLINYIIVINAAPDDFPPQVPIPFDYSIVVFAVIFVFFSMLFLLIFKKSYNIPTKANRKNI